MFAYLGFGPGQEFIPYFLALLAFVWAAVIAVLQWPFLALVRLIRGKRAGASPVPTTQTVPNPEPVAETPKSDQS
jgi:hypothetical protein